MEEEWLPEDVIIDAAEADQVEVSAEVELE